MSTQRRLPGTEAEHDRDGEDDELEPEPDVVAVPTGSACYAPDQIHHPDCPRVGGDAQTMSRADGAQMVLVGQLKWADCMEAADD